VAAEESVPALAREMLGMLARISHTGWDLRGDRGSYTLTLWR
jgi:hypothetical protein